MVIAELVTGELAHVAYVELLPFDRAPDVLMWGERVFVHREREGDEPEPPLFVEAFVAVSLTPSPGLPVPGARPRLSVVDGGVR